MQRTHKRRAWMRDTRNRVVIGIGQQRGEAQLTGASPAARRVEFGTIMLWYYLADRTHTFPRGTKVCPCSSACEDPHQK